MQGSWLSLCVPHGRDMTEKRFKHLQWRDKRPPMLPFESYVLLEKLEGSPASKPAPDITSITASAAPSTDIALGGRARWGSSLCPRS